MRHLALTLSLASALLLGFTDDTEDQFVAYEFKTTK
jgi:hypothetical protein